MRTKVVDDGLGGRQRSGQHNNQPSTEGSSRCSLLMLPEAAAIVVDILTNADCGEEDRQCNCTAAAGATDGTTTATDAPTATRAKERYLQLAGEEHARYYSTAATLSSAPSAVVMPSREG